MVDFKSDKHSGGSPISVVIALVKLSAIATPFILPSPLVSGIDSWYH